MNTLFQNWHIVRVLQLAMGLLLVGSYLFYAQDGVTLAFGAILLLQAAFNISCVGGACGVPRKMTGKPPAFDAKVWEEADYEEIGPTR